MLISYPALLEGAGQIYMFAMGIIFALIILKIFDFLNNKPPLKILALSDKISYQFYIVHQIFLIKYLSLLHITKYLGLNIFFAFIVSLIFACVLWYIENIIKKLFKFINDN